jgi:hypothetical protein
MSQITGGQNFYYAVGVLDEADREKAAILLSRQVAFCPLRAAKTYRR